MVCRNVSGDETKQEWFCDERAAHQRRAYGQTLEDVIERQRSRFGQENIG
jgi:hypothetical protein